jgi:hypothetical protein
MEAESVLATLYNNWLLNGSGYISYFLIVFTLALCGAWKTRVVLWIPGHIASMPEWRMTRNG